MCMLGAEATITQAGKGKQRVTMWGVWNKASGTSRVREPRVRVETMEKEYVWQETARRQ